MRKKASRLLTPLAGVLAVSAAFNALLWVAAIWVFPRNTPVAILHYSAIVGVDFIGGSRQIYVLPLIGLAVLVGNTTLGYLIRPVSWRAAWLLWGATLLVQSVLVLAFSILWQLNR